MSMLSVVVDAGNVTVDDDNVGSSPRSQCLGNTLLSSAVLNDLLHSLQRPLRCFTPWRSWHVEHLVCYLGAPRPYHALP